MDGSVGGGGGGTNPKGGGRTFILKAQSEPTEVNEENEVRTDFGTQT